MRKMDKTKISADDRRTIVILSVSSDIGSALAKMYLRDGHTVIGTYRHAKSIGKLRQSKKCHLLHCDISQKKSIEDFLIRYQRLHMKWDTCISCPATPLPLTPFFKTNFDEWISSIRVNAIEQLRVLHGLHRFRNTSQTANVFFFGSGGVNTSVANLSAYTVAKLFLVKICELLHAENKDLNICVIGPGKVQTKIHQLIAQNPHVSKEKYLETMEFIKSGKGTRFSDIYQFIQWLCTIGKDISSGRNFVITDDWKHNQGRKLVKALRSDPDMFMFRRNLGR